MAFLIENRNAILAIFDIIGKELDFDPNKASLNVSDISPIRAQIGLSFRARALGNEKYESRIDFLEKNGTILCTLTVFASRKDTLVKSATVKIDADVKKTLNHIKASVITICESTKEKLKESPL